MQKHNTIAHICIAATLFFVGWIAALLLNNPYGITAVQQAVSRTSIVEQPKGKLLRNTRITGRFMAVENNLGMVTVGFLPYSKIIPEDSIQFRIKEVNAKDWYYTNTVQSGAVEGAPLYPFGFPVIAQSKNKQFVFDVSSLSGTETNAVQLNAYDPHITAVYRLTKPTSISGVYNVVSFIWTKVLLSVTNMTVSFSSLLFFLPFFLYIFRKKSSMMQTLLPMIILLGIAADVLFLQQVYMGVFVFFAVYWIVAMRKYAIPSEANYVVSALLCLLWVPLLFVSSSYMQNKINIWMYFFLVFGTIQMLVDERNGEKR